MSAAVKLWELLEGRDILDQFLAETEGEETPTIAALFEQLEGDLNAKGESVARWIREKEAQIAAFKAEEQWLANKRRARENAIASTKAYFCELLRQLDRKELGTDRAKLCRQNGAAKLEGELTETQLACIDGPAAAAVQLVPATFTLNRRAALELLKAGTSIDGLRVVETEHVRIR